MSVPKDAHYDYLFKIVLVGDAQVGKTHLLSRYMKGELPKAPAATIGVEFATRLVELAGIGVVKAQIWDTAGQERYRAITSAHYRKAVGALLVYDVTRLESFENCRTWLTELRNGAGPEVSIVLVGNKYDLVENDDSARAVKTAYAEQFARENGLLFFESSAVSAYNVTVVFEDLIRAVHARQPAEAVKENSGPGEPLRMGGAPEALSKCTDGAGC
eukprot:TRINITY_DN123901_c0_g1_i1.p2 TRINITY_DN123901_c0_g1~~TRINITY_DN123901_c0_g1_i1.p2  ORF type:complete len:216 (+),score=46.87 TRINITY_DN123901_c0_g1_i1:111-758(+)